LTEEGRVSTKMSAIHLMSYDRSTQMMIYMIHMVCKSHYKGSDDDNGEYKRFKTICSLILKDDNWGRYITEANLINFARYLIHMIIVIIEHDHCSEMIESLIAKAEKGEFTEGKMISLSKEIAIVRQTFVNIARDFKDYSTLKAQIYRVKQDTLDFHIVIEKSIGQ